MFYTRTNRMLMCNACNECEQKPRDNDAPYEITDCTDIWETSLRARAPVYVYD